MTIRELENSAANKVAKSSTYSRSDRSVWS